MIRFVGPESELVFAGRYPLHLERRHCKQSEFERRLIAKSHVRPALIIVSAARLDQRPGFADRFAPMQVLTVFAALTGRILSICIMIIGLPSN
jgi:hypothetical protein